MTPAPRLVRQYFYSREHWYYLSYYLKRSPELTDLTILPEYLHARLEKPENIATISSLFYNYPFFFAGKLGKDTGETKGKKDNKSHFHARQEGRVVFRGNLGIPDID